MVIITNGSSIFEVTKGAYETIYKKQGFERLGTGTKAPTFKEVAKGAKKSVPSVVEDVEDVDDTSSDEDTEVDDEVTTKLIVLEEKPISHWNKDDVKFYAKENGIDLSGTKNVNEAKELIKKFLDKKDAE